ncbi:MAG: nodulation protein NfeD [Hadesarchaea archaeon]|nr:nodulation protein NfeD [Hadesarchaea archaeon]
MNKRALALAVGLLILGCLIVSETGRAQQSFVYSIEVEGTIDAGISNFVRKAIDRAERENVPLIIKLNTPGGLLTSTKEIVDRILTAEVKIVVWITPRGAWGASAGTYILVASEVAAMDEATAIGACQPRPEDPKVTAYMAEWLGSIAENRGRPRETVELFVTQNLTMNPKEAYDNGVIELRATSIENILDNIGFSGARVEQINMGLFEKILRVLSDPDVASILFILGFFGLLFEITTPGIGVPGVAGMICLLLGLWGMGVLQINYAGVALLLLGIALIVTEIFTPGFGVFGVGGGLALILGLMMVGVYKEPWVGGVSSDLVKGVAIALLIAFAVFILLIRRTVRKPPVVGKEELIGQVGAAVTGIAPRGLIKLRGELWTATSKEYIKEGEQVVVKDVKGIMLVVQKHRARKKK